MKHSDKLDQLATALVAARADLHHAPMDGFNPHFKSKFAKLPTVIDHCLPVLAKHGLTVVQLPAITDGGHVGLTTMLLHTSGQYIEETIAAPGGKMDAQGVGIITTYLRRQGLQAVTGTSSEEDDDAEGDRKDAPTPSQVSGAAGQGVVMVTPAQFGKLNALLTSRGWPPFATPNAADSSSKMCSYATQYSNGIAQKWTHLTTEQADAVLAAITQSLPTKPATKPATA